MPVTAVAVSVEGGGRASLHGTGSSPVSKRKVAHARGVVNKARRIDLSGSFKRAEPATVNGGAGQQEGRAVGSSHSTSMCSFVSLIAQSGFSVLSVSVSDWCRVSFCWRCVLLTVSGLPCLVCLTSMFLAFYVLGALLLSLRRPSNIVLFLDQEIRTMMAESNLWSFGFFEACNFFLRTTIVTFGAHINDTLSPLLADRFVTPFQTIADYIQTLLMCTASPSTWATNAPRTSRTRSLHRSELQANFRCVLSVNLPRLHTVQLDILLRGRKQIGRCLQQELFIRSICAQRARHPLQWGTEPSQDTWTLSHIIRIMFQPNIIAHGKLFIQQIWGRLHLTSNVDWSLLWTQKMWRVLLKLNGDNWMGVKLNNVTLQVHSKKVAQAEDSDSDTSNWQIIRRPPSTSLWYWWCFAGSFVASLSLCW